MKFIFCIVLGLSLCSCAHFKDLFVPDVDHQGYAKVKKMDLTVEILAAVNSQAITKIYIENRGLKETYLEKESTRAIVKKMMATYGFEIADSLAEADTVLLYSFATGPVSKTITRPTYSYIAPQAYNYYGANGAYVGSAHQTGIGSLYVSGQQTTTYRMNANALFLMFFEKPKYVSAIKKKLNDISEAASWEATLSSVSNSDDKPFIVGMMMKGVGSFFPNLQEGKFELVVTDEPLTQTALDTASVD